MSASLAKIMVVEDESIVAKDLELTLKRLGYIVPATASSSDDALSKAAQYRPDLVLLDVHIKGATDGIATARRLRQEMNIPVIYLTVYADDDTVARAKETEPFGYLRMREIVADLGRFARPEASPARSAVDLWESLETAIRLSSHQIKHHALIVREPGATPPVQANAQRLEQVFINLLVNAAQAMPDGRPQANRIRVVTRTDGEGRAVVEIEDTGAGIPAEVKARMFDPFFTTRPSARARSKREEWFCLNTTARKRIVTAPGAPTKT